MMAKRFYNLKQVNANNMIDVMAIENLYIDKYLSDKHYFRKHGKDAYYGQK